MTSTSSTTILGKVKIVAFVIGRLLEAMKTGKKVTVTIETDEGQGPGDACEPVTS